MVKRNLDGKGKGEYSYDYKNDILVFKIQNRNYKMSFEFQNFVADIDEENFITGMRIFDASKVFGIEKILLKSIVSCNFNADVEDGIITIKLKITSKLRNRLIPFLGKTESFTEHFTQKAPKPILNSSVQCGMV